MAMYQIDKTKAIKLYYAKNKARRSGVVEAGEREGVFSL
jgi:hypothetical protein